MMERAQNDYADFCLSERLRVAATILPVELRGDLLYRASKACPFNMGVWAARARLLSEAAQAGHDLDADAWVAEVEEAAASEPANGYNLATPNVKIVASSEQSLTFPKAANMLKNKGRWQSDYVPDGGTVRPQPARHPPRWIPHAASVRMPF